MNQIYNCQFVQSLMEEGAQLIDVRSTVEFARGALKGAINMPMDRFQYHKDDIDENKPVLLYCRSGQRSEMVKRFLESCGFSQVYNIGSYQNFQGC